MIRRAALLLVLLIASPAAAVQWLKQSTAVVIPFGPFLDKTDGVTLETGMVASIDHGTTGIFLSKNGGTLTIRHATITASTYDSYGIYKVTLDTTDTATLGSLRVAFSEAATCLPVWMDFMVVPANIWDSYFGADLLDTSVVQWTGTNVAAPASAGYVYATIKDGTGTGEIDTNSGAIVAVTTVNGLAANSVTAAALAADAGTELGTANWATTTRELTALDEDNTTLDINGTTIGTVTTYTGNTPQTGDSFARIGATGSGLTSLAPSATAMSTAQWTNTRAGYLDNLSGGAVALSSALATAQADLDLYDTDDEHAAAVLNAATASYGSAGSYGLLFETDLDATISSRLASASYTAPLDAAGTRTAVGLASANLDTQLAAIDDYVDAEVAAIKAKTDNLPSDPADASDVAASIANVQSDTDNLQTRTPAALVGGRTDASLGACASGAVTATCIADASLDRATFAADTGLLTLRSNTATAGSASTITLDASAVATNDYYRGVIKLTGGTGAGQTAVIWQYIGSTKVASVYPDWATAPDNTTTFAIVGWQ